MMRYLLSFCFVLATGLLLAQTSSQRAAVLVSATAQSSPPRITLSWPSMASTTSLTIYRKLKSGTSWGSAIATPAASDLSWQDNTVTVGTAYEYRIVRVSNGVTGNGYISTGVEVAPIDFRGKLILLVDNTIASSLSSELLQLEQDLRADGWGVLRSDVSPSASVTSVRATVIGHYNSDPANVKAVYIIGHVPVPYSGNQNPDGHAEHSGAWPCDGYYGELNGTWTDNTVNSGGMQRPQNTNVPGDGKFDQSTFPNPVELQVGRVDLSDLPAFSTSNVELMRNYLNKAHGFKTKAWTPQARGIMFDNLQWVGNPLAASGWRAMGPLVGASNITTALQAAWPFYTLVDDSYLWTYSSGGGGQETTQGVITYHGAANVGSVHDYAASPMNGVFNMAFGSYFGDWDNKNNFLRAPLASGQALTNVWSAIPGWYFHHMGQGENIGYSTWITMNNTSLYQPLTDGWQGSIGKCHLGLMGDPSLRMIMLAPPQNLTVNNSGGNAAFSWTASTEPGLAGYHIYEFQTDGTITRLTTSPVAGTSYTNPAIPFVAGKQYMVRAVKLESGFSGSYFNLSLGAIGTASGGGPVNDCLGVPGGTAVPGAACNDNNPCTTNDAWNASCQCVGAAPSAPAISSLTSNSPVCAGGTLTFTLTASGAGPLAYAWT
ncbi:MAG: hypothetical protein JNM49_07825, partial [Flavobacteriales bacterium]|nr:hypothetical protein [Flavobacteriales bacterium]